MPNFFNGDFFGGGFFGESEVARSGGGGIDPGEGVKHRYPPVKPTGLPILHLPKKKTTTQAEHDVESRLQQAHAERAEISARLAREFAEERVLLESQPAIETMSMAEIDAEIGVLLRKKLRTDEEDVILLLLMVAASAA